MKITSVECFLGDYITIKVNTDEGIYGYGEAGLAYGSSFEAAYGQCQDFAKRVIGKDPLNTEEIWEDFHRHTFWGMGGGSVVTAGMAAYDIAMWDIKGKYYNAPVYQLLGGKTNKKLRAYASQIQFGWSDIIQVKNGGFEGALLYEPEEYFEVTKNAMRDGYTAVKVDPVYAPADSGASFAEVRRTHGNQIRGSYPEKELRKSVERVAAIREAGGPELDIIVELHSLLDTNTAAELGRALEPYRIMYMEEPTSPENPSNYRFLHESCRIPLATGERSFTRWGFRQFFEDRTLSVVQPDLANTGGISETKRICEMAQVYDMAAQLHVCGGPIANAAALHLETVLANFLIHEEHMANLAQKYTKCGKYLYKPVDGYYTVPELPGLGQELSEWAIENAKKRCVIS